MIERNSPVLAVAMNAASKPSEEKYLLHWRPLKNDLPEHQVHFWQGAGKTMVRLRLILERIQLKMTCAPLWVMNHFTEAKCEIPIVSPASVFEYYTSFHGKFIHNEYPCSIEDTPLKCIDDFKIFTEFLLETQSTDSSQCGFPSDPFDYPLLVTDDNQLRVFDQRNKVLHSKYAHLFPLNPDKFLHRDLVELPYSVSYSVSVSDDETLRISVVKELIENILPVQLKNLYVSTESETIKKVDISNLWKCCSDDEVFKSVVPEVLKVWALLLTKDGRLFRCGSSEQLLPIIPLTAMKSLTSVFNIAAYTSVAAVVEHMLRAPFLDTEVVPVETVDSLCPSFSDPKQILNNLYYLQREFPFTKAMTVQNTSVLLTYFGGIHFKKELQCCLTIKCLPLFETVDGSFVPIEGKIVHIWPYNFCETGCENWLRGIDVVFLKPTACWSTLGCEVELGIGRISAEEVYVQYIFPSFYKLNKKERYTHLKHIRDFLFEMNLSKQNNRNWKISSPALRFTSGLKYLECIGDDGTPLQPVSNFYTHKKTIFTIFLEHFQRLPKDIVQEEDELWTEFFLKLGLHDSVTPDEYCGLCKDVANGKLKDNTRTASRTLLDYLFSPDEAKLHQFHSNKGLLKKVSDIAFVCPVHMPELEWIHKVLPTTNRVILAQEEVPLCKLSGSCLAQSKELVWTVVPIVSVTVNAQKEVLESLGIHIQPNVQNVVKNIMNLSKTQFANPGLFMNYSVPNCRKGHTNLTDVMLIIFRFLKPKQCQLNIEELKTLRCIPVHAITHESGGQYPVLVEPYRVVFRDVTETHSYYPFVHSISSPFYEARKLLSALGVGDSVQIRQMQMVLESVYETSGGNKLEPNTCDVVNCAVHELATLLLRSTSFQTIKEETTISEKLTPLYLCGTDKRMHHVDCLVHSRIRNVNLRGTKFYLLWTPKMLPEEFFELLPEAVRPKPLSVLCTSMVSSTCEICEKTPYAIDLEKRLGNPNLSLAMCITVKHVTVKMDSQERERYCETFEQHLSMLFQTLKIHCVKQLKIDMFLVGDDPLVVASKSVKCYLQKEESSYHLYLDANVRNVHIGEVHKCIAKELVRCLKGSPLTELELHKLNEFLEALLCAGSSEDIYETLQDSEINCLELQNAINFDMDEPKLGNYIPKWLQVERLDLRNTNIFQPQEWVAYQVSEERYIYAQVVHPVCLKDSKGEPLKPIHMEYIIFTNVEDEEGKRVTATDLYKFIRGEIQHRDSIPVDPDCQEVVPFEGHPCDAHPSNETFDLHQAKEEIRKELQDIRYLSKTDQRKAISRLYLRWHPDKNRSNQEVAEEAFKFLKDELDKLEQSSEISASTCVGRNYSWHDYQRSWDETAREHMFYANSQDGSSSDQATSSSYRHRRGGSGGRGGFYSSVFTPSPNVHEGKRWVRQAVADCLALETLLNEAQTHADLSAHVCFMAHQVAEKALKGGMYATCGLGENSLKSHNISPLGHAIEAVRPVKACGLAVLTSPLEPYYLDTRFPNRCHEPSIPSDNFSFSAAEAAAEYAMGVLKIVRDVLNM